MHTTEPDDGPTGAVAGRLLTARQVAARLGLGKTKVYEMLASGQLPTITLGERSKRVPEGALVEWIRRNTRLADGSIH